MNTVETKNMPDPERVAFLRSLPLAVKQSLSKEEANAFLYDLPWPETLYEKLKDFIEEEE
ncbi:MAG: hypothetical protein OEV73_06495 [Desulfobulbaceae bacterium]|nr:hypothetical protein [Desulfobulbaceae bacterium]